MAETPIRLHPTVERGAPYRYIAEHGWAPEQAVSALFAKEAADFEHTPLIKLRGSEREKVKPLSSYGAGSWLARQLLASTTPVTMSERLAFVRCGLALDDSEEASEGPPAPT